MITFQNENGQRTDENQKQSDIKQAFDENMHSNPTAGAIAASGNPEGAAPAIPNIPQVPQMVRC